MAKVNPMWAKARERAKADKGSGGELPIGKYIARVTDAKIEQGDKGERVHFVYTIVDGEYAGNTQHEWLGMDSEDRLTWLLQRCAQYERAGLELDIDEFGPDDLKGLLETIVENKIRVGFRLVEKGEYINVRGFTVYDEERQTDEDDEVKLADLIKSDKAKAKAATPTKAAKQTPAPAAATTGKVVKAPAPAPASEPEDEEDEDDEELSHPLPIGSVISFTQKDKELQGPVTEVLVKTQHYQVTIGKKVYAVGWDSVEVLSVPTPTEPASEPEAETSEDEDEGSVEVGSKVGFDYKGTTVSGKVTAIDEEDEELTVEMVDGPKPGKVVTVSLEDIELLDD